MRHFYWTIAESRTLLEEVIGKAHEKMQRKPGSKCKDCKSETGVPVSKRKRKSNNAARKIESVTRKGASGDGPYVQEVRINETVLHQLGLPAQLRRRSPETGTDVARKVRGIGKAAGFTDFRDAAFGVVQ